MPRFMDFHEDLSRLHVVVSTLWEAAWGDIELPRGPARPE